MDLKKSEPDIWLPLFITSDESAEQIWYWLAEKENNNHPLRFIVVKIWNQYISNQHQQPHLTIAISNRDKKELRRPH